MLIYDEPFDQTIKEDIFDETEHSFAVCIPTWCKETISEQQKKEILAKNCSEKTLEILIDTAFETLEKQLSQYTRRKSQIALSKQMLFSAYSKKQAVIEAETGVGKSFAYLIAGITFASITGKKFLVSTNTRNLQSQLFHKDIVLLHKLLNTELTYSLALGSTNYFCKVRYDQQSIETSFSKNIQPYLLKKWVNKVFFDKIDGNIFEVDFDINQQDWKKINRDPQECPHGKCSYFYKCNYFLAKKRWATSRIIISNHHLFFQNLEQEQQLLPAVQWTVIDEAHSFHTTGIQISTKGFSKDIINEKWKQINGILKQSKSIKEKQYEKIQKCFKELIYSWEQYFQEWENELELHFKQNISLLITSSIDITPAALLTYINSCSQEIDKLLQNEENIELTNHYQSLLLFLASSTAFFETYRGLDFSTSIFWVEKNQETFFLKLTPFSLKEKYQKELSVPMAFTSATLGFSPSGKRIENKQVMAPASYFHTFWENISFEYKKKKKNNELVEKIYLSNFEYPQQAVLYIPKHIQNPKWTPNNEYEEQYLKTLAEEIILLIQESDGGTLVLFTSKSILTYVEEILLERVKYEIFSQCNLGAHNALQKFIANKNSILLGLNSFWQGIDIPGFGLRMLIITKLMFPIPNDPIFKAQSNELEKNGKKSFWELSLPFASIMLRQAFGRLIRSEQDTGVIAILDSRIIQKQYGAALIKNLPQLNTAYSFEELKKLIKKQQIYKKNDI